METPVPAPADPDPQEAVATSPVADGPAVDGPVTGGPVWRFMITPRWIAWHLFAVVAVWLMLWLGDWQLHRALSGNGLSWAYTFEWPLFAGFGIVFWARTVRDEFRLRRGDDGTAAKDDEAAAEPALPEGIGTRQIERPGDDADDAELASYNAYLARLSAEVNASAKRRNRK